MSRPTGERSVQTASIDEQFDLTGLMLASTYLWGVFRTDGDTPDTFTAMRRLSDGPTWPARLLLHSNVCAAGIQRHDTPMTAARSIDVVDWGAPAVAGAEPFELVLPEGVNATARWFEGALLDVSGHEVVPGLQWWLPAEADHEGMHYRSRIFRVNGLVAGREVAGFIGCDEVRLAPGRENYVDDPITAAHLSHAWCTWATEYDDGSIEAGHVAFGRDGFHFAVRAANGAAHSAGVVTGDVEVDAVGGLDRIHMDIDGEAWVFDADTRGRPLQPLPGPVRQAEGWFRRVAEHRAAQVWFATPEVPAR
jgi:hypothetical protein